MITAGDHVPVMPLIEVPGKAPAVAPTQYGPNCANVGVTSAFTTTIHRSRCSTLTCHRRERIGGRPGVDVRMSAAVHVPVMPFDRGAW